MRIDKTYVFGAAKVRPIKVEFRLGETHPCNKCCFFDPAEREKMCLQYVTSKGHTAMAICSVLDGEEGNPNVSINFEKL